MLLEETDLLRAVLLTLREQGGHGSAVLDSVHEPREPRNGVQRDAVSEQGLREADVPRRGVPREEQDGNDEEQEGGVQEDDEGEREPHRQHGLHDRRGREHGERPEMRVDSGEQERDRHHGLRVGAPAEETELVQSVRDDDHRGHRQEAEEGAPALAIALRPDPCEGDEQGDGEVNRKAKRTELEALLPPHLPAEEHAEVQDRGRRGQEVQRPRRAGDQVDLDDREGDGAEGDPHLVPHPPASPVHRGGDEQEPQTHDRAREVEVHGGR